MVNVLRCLDLVLLMAIWVVSSLIARSSLYVSAPDLIGPAIATDLIVTALIVHWLVGLRLGRLPQWTIGVVVLIGVALTAVLIPDQTGLVMLLAGLAEIVVLAVAITRLRKLLGAAREARACGMDRADAFETGLAAALEAPRLASAIRLEAEVVWLALSGWFRRPRLPDATAAFTHHVESGWMYLAGVLLALSIVEGAGLHLILEATGHPTIAWIVTAVHLYAIVWLLGDAHGLRLHPTRVDDAHLHLRLGLRWRADIHRLRILRVQRFSGDPDDRHLSLVVAGDPNVLVQLDGPVEVRGLFGLRRRADTLLLQVDDPGGFVTSFDA
jgi:hypothetical protein